MANRRQMRRWKRIGMKGGIWGWAMGVGNLLGQTLLWHGTPATMDGKFLARLGPPIVDGRSGVCLVVHVSGDTGRTGFMGLVHDVCRVAKQLLSGSPLQPAAGHRCR